MTARVCLIGCGFFAHNHMSAWADLGDADVVAVCDRDRDRAQAMAKDFGVDAVFTDASEMLAAMAPDIVDIVTTPPSHRALVEIAAPLARLVICQKPIADSRTDAAAMVDAAAQAETTLLIHENFRWQNGFVRLREAIASGAIGTPAFARFSFRHRFDVYAGQPYLASVPRLALMDVGIHLYDLARLFMGEVESLTCEVQTRNPKVAGEDAFTTMLRHKSGGVSVVDASFHSRLDPDPFPQTLAVVEGDAGTLELTAGYRLIQHDARGSVVHDVEPVVPPWGEKPWHGVQSSVVALQRHALDVLAGKAVAQPSGADNLHTLDLALASYDSAASGQRIAMDDWRKAQA